MPTTPPPPFLPTPPPPPSRWESDVDDLMSVIEALMLKMSRNEAEQFLEEIGYRVEVRLEEIADGT